MSPENGVVLMKLGLASWRRTPHSRPSGVVHKRPDIALEYLDSEAMAMDSRLFLMDPTPITDRGNFYTVPLG
jgi:hypothetical protein